MSSLEYHDLLSVAKQFGDFLERDAFHLWDEKAHPGNSKARYDYKHQKVFPPDICECRSCDLEVHLPRSV